MSHLNVSPTLISQVYARLPVRPHPALLQLQANLFRSQVRRLARGILRPRRVVLSLIAILLAVVWTAQTALAVLFRQPGNPESVREWVALGMYAYAAWHFLKAALRPTLNPMEWTPAETQWLHGSPLSKADLLGFRVASVTSAAVVKAACFCLVMSPDIRQPALAAVAMLLGLVIIDLLRLAFEIAAWGLRPAARGMLATFAIGAIMLALGQATWRMTHLEQHPDNWLAMALAGLGELQAMHHETIWRYGAVPFRAISSLAFSDTWSAAGVGGVVALLAATIGLANTVGWLNHYGNVSRSRREQQDHLRLLGRGDAHIRCDNNLSTSPTSNAATAAIPVATRRSVPPLQHAATIGWTQLLGMRFYAQSLIVSFLAPGILSLLPIAFPIRGIPVLMQVGGSLAFYSYVLLPTAIKFDFRRNIDRICIFKRTPASPLAVTLGQLATPFAALTIFQACVLTIAFCFGEASWLGMATAMLLLIPANALVVSTENLVFLLYPYRIHQEGVEIFLRSVLMFTGKGLAMLLALGAVLAWSVTCNWLIGASGPVRAIFFLSGLVIATALLALGATWLLTRTYRRFDVTSDLPA